MTEVRRGGRQVPVAVGMGGPQSVQDPVVGRVIAQIQANIVELFRRLANIEKKIADIEEAPVVREKPVPRLQTTKAIAPRPTEDLRARVKDLEDDLAALSHPVYESASKIYQTSNNALLSHFS